MLSTWRNPWSVPVIFHIATSAHYLTNRQDPHLTVHTAADPFSHTVSIPETQPSPAVLTPKPIANPGQHKRTSEAGSLEPVSTSKRLKLDQESVRPGQTVIDAKTMKDASDTADKPPKKRKKATLPGAKDVQAVSSTVEDVQKSKVGGSLKRAGEKRLGSGQDGAKVLTWDRMFGKAFVPKGQQVSNIHRSVEEDDWITHNFCRYTRPSTSAISSLPSPVPYHHLAAILRLQRP